MSIGRPLQFNPDHALDAAMHLFWIKGYEATSLQQLLDTMKLSKSSFYQTFKSKHQLFESCLRHYELTLINELNQKYSDSENGLQFIQNLFNEMSQECSKNTSPKGCLLMNTVSEFAQTDPGIASLVSKSLEKFYQVFFNAINNAQKHGLIDSQRNTEALARYLISSMSGLKNMVKAGSNKTTISQINSVVLSSLN